MLNISPHAFWTLFVSHPPPHPFLHFPHCSLYIYLSAHTRSSIFLLSHPSFHSQPPCPPCSCIFLHLHIIHSVSSSIALSGLPPSHSSFSVCPSHSSPSALQPSFIQVKHNSLLWSPLVILHTHVQFLSLLYYLWPVSLIPIAQWHLFA